MRAARTTWLLLLAGQMTLLSGCTTKALWDSGCFARFHEPDQPPNLRLFYSERRQDVLVHYTEVRDSDEAVRKRAYWLKQNVARIEQRQKPSFVALTEAQGLEIVPVVDSPGHPVPVLGHGHYAVASTNGGAFTLYATNQNLGSFELPVYEDASGKMKQALLTPFAVTADLTIIGGAIAYCLLPGCWAGLNDATGNGSHNHGR